MRSDISLNIIGNTRGFQSDGCMASAWKDCRYVNLVRAIIFSISGVDGQAGSRNVATQ